MRKDLSYRYTLQPYKGRSTRHICPKCGKREFVLYIDTETGRPINERVGRCNREINCGYHFPPREYFRTICSPIKSRIDRRLDFVIIRNAQESDVTLESECNFINERYVTETLKDYSKNTLANFLKDWFDVESVKRVLWRYCVGTALFKSYEGAVIYWQKDIKSNYRTGKVMLYGENGHRIRDKINWAHRLIDEYKDKFNLHQCIFGEHLFSNDIERVCVVESEKTAIICDLYYRNSKVLWVACGGLNNLDAERLSVFRSKKLILFPDLDGVSKWIGKKEELKELGFNVSVSEWYKSIKNKEVIKNGYDLADLVMDILKAKRCASNTINKEDGNKFQYEMVVDVLPFDNLNFNEEVQDIVQGNVDF